MQGAMLISDTWPELSNKVIWAETLYYSHKRKQKDGSIKTLKQGNYDGSSKGMEKFGFGVLMKWLKLINEASHPTPTARPNENARIKKKVPKKDTNDDEEYVQSESNSDSFDDDFGDTFHSGSSTSESELYVHFYRIHL